MQGMRFFAALLALAGLAMTVAPPASSQDAVHWTLLTKDVAANTTTAIRLRLVDGNGNPDARPVHIASVRVDMSPDNMASMTAPAKLLPGSEPGVVVVEANFTAPGRWAIILSGTVNGRPIKGSAIVTARQKTAAASHTLLYYRNPMVPADTSPVPRKDAMGMDYVPVYADEIVKIPGAIRLTSEKIQRAGVRMIAVSSMPLARTVRATGIIAADENRQAIVAARFNGFIEKLFVSQTGDIVRAGQPLMRVWIESPEVLVKEADYIGSLASGSAANAKFAEVILRQYGVAQSELSAMAKNGAPSRIVTITAPANGTVMEKPAVQGMRFAAGEPLFKITDVSRLWLIAQVSERDLAALKPGQAATITFRDDPAISREGKVLFVYPELDPVTRTARTRIAMENPENLLRIGQFAEVRIQVPLSARPVLAVPVSAIVDDGTRQLVFVARPGGMFEPRNVTLGARSGDMIEVRQGLAEGERIVATGNFLIDAESNLETALQAFKPVSRP